jgi:UDP:flavonoid glycosyltransferase YjiC (YdhE family)
MYFILVDTKLVGPLLSSPAEPLPAELEQFVRGSGDEGVILVSFGSILSEISDQTIAPMADVFSTLPQRIIWKLDTGMVIRNFISTVFVFFGFI